MHAQPTVTVPLDENVVFSLRRLEHLSLAERDALLSQIASLVEAAAPSAPAAPAPPAPPAVSSTPTKTTSVYTTPSEPSTIALGRRHAPHSDLLPLFDYFHWLGSLKRAKRTGWVLEDVPLPESIADHMYRMSMLAMALPASLAIDRPRCIKLALVHDMAEAIVGDIPPAANIAKPVKHAMELDAMQRLHAMVGQDDIYDAWNEYEAQKTPEAIMVKDLDRFEMLLQAFEYETEHAKNLQSFFTATQGFFKTDTVKAWAEHLLRVRAAAAAAGVA